VLWQIPWNGGLYLTTVDPVEFTLTHQDFGARARAR
jgi:hypothetical protein